MNQDKEHRHSELRMIPLNRIEILNPRERNSRVFEQIVGNIQSIGCWRHLNSDPPCRSNIDPGRIAEFGISNCG